MQMTVSDWMTTSEIDRLRAYLQSAIIVGGGSVTLDHETARLIAEGMDQLRELMGNVAPLRRR